MYGNVECENMEAVEVRGGGDGGGSGAARHLRVAAGADGGAACDEGLVSRDDLV